jgi:cytoskeletal protein CcmA (bactofilin family)
MASESTIGSSTVVRGSVRGEGGLSIHGRIEGSVAVSGELLIAETALIRSDVSALRVVVRGAVLGNISAEQAIVLEAGARVVGDLNAPQIGIRPGGLCRGHVSTAGPVSASEIETGRSVSRARTSPKAISVAVAPIGRSALSPPAARAAAPPPAARPAAPGRPPARAPSALTPLTPPSAATGTASSSAARPAAIAPPVAMPRAAPAERVASAASNVRPEPATVPRAEVVPIQIAASAPLPSAGMTHTDTVPSATITPSNVDPDPDEETASLGSADQGGGPPPPVVPALRKGAKAQLRRKGAR